MLPYNLAALGSMKYFSSSMILFNEFSLTLSKATRSRGTRTSVFLRSCNPDYSLNKCSNESLTQGIALEFSVLYRASVSTYSFSQSFPLCFVTCPCINHLSE